MDCQGGRVRVRVDVGMANDRQQSEVDIVAGEDALLAGSFPGLPQRPGADAENLRQPRHNLRGLASQHPRLCFSIDEEQVNQLVIGVAAEVFEQDCLVRLSHQRAYVFQLHRLLNAQDSVLVGFQERRRSGIWGLPL